MKNFDLFSTVPIVDHYLRHWAYWKRVLLLVVPVSVPLFILAAIENDTIFFKPSIVVRFLVTLPLLLFTGVFASRGLNRVIQKILKSSIVQGKDLDNFLHWLSMMNNYRERRFIHFIGTCLIFIVSIYDYLSPKQLWLLNLEGEKFSLSALWFFFLARPVYWMVLLNYIFCVLLWSIFIIRVSFMNLNIRVPHGDGVGGLAILNKTISAFNFSSFAISTAIAAEMSEHILKGVPLEKYYLPLGLYSLLPITFHVVPLLFFFFSMLIGKRKGLAKYDHAFVQHLDHFVSKRIDRVDNYQVALDVNDYSSTADFNSVIEKSHAMKLLPISKKTVMQLLFFFYLPFIPVALLTLPYPVVAKYLELLIKGIL